jgi:hypothetical protein
MSEVGKIEQGGGGARCETATTRAERSNDERQDEVKHHLPVERYQDAFLCRNWMAS